MKNEFQAAEGHGVNLRATPMPHGNGVTDCEVLVVEPNARLSYGWDASGEEAAKGLKTVVTWTLTPTKGGTHVRMEQSGPKKRPTIRVQPTAGSGFSAVWKRWSRGWIEN